MLSSNLSSSITSNAPIYSNGLGFTLGAIGHWENLVLAHIFDHEELKASIAMFLYILMDLVSLGLVARSNWALENHFLARIIDLQIFFTDWSRAK